MNNIEYLDVVNAIKRNNLKSRYDVVAFYVGFYGSVNGKILDYINKAYDDLFII